MWVSGCKCGCAQSYIFVKCTCLSLWWGGRLAGGGGGSGVEEGRGARVCVEGGHGAHALPDHDPPNHVPT